MEIIIKETGCKKETCKQEPVFKMKDSVLISCELNGCTAVTIPADVKIIGKMCFASTDVEEIILPEGIKCIESKAFADCFNLKRINFPEGLETVKDRAFMNCGSLVEVILPTTLTKIGDYTFHNAGIEQLTLPDPKNVLSIGISVFGAIKIKSINVPKNFRLNKAMFSTCQQLRSVNFEADWVTIPERCFYYCTNLEEIDISKALFIKDSAFLECHNLSVNVIPAHTYVSACAFMKTGVEDVTIEDISEVEEKAFSDCKSLKKLTINVPDGPAIADDLCIPEELAARCTNLQTVTFTGHAENLLSIKAAAFRETTMLTEITLPEKLKTIGRQTFSESGLKSITLPDSVEFTETECFRDCYNLEEVTLPAKEFVVPDGMFMNCTALKKVNNADKIVQLGKYAFYGANSLKQVDLSSAVNIGGSAFECSGLTSVKLSKCCTTLDMNAFYKCKNLKLADLSESSIEYFAPYIFYRCGESQHMTEIILPDKVWNVDECAFVECYIKNLNIAAAASWKNVMISENAFIESNIDVLTFVDNPDGHVYLNESAFKNAFIGELTIPDYLYDKYKNVWDNVKSVWDDVDK